MGSLRFTVPNREFLHAEDIERIYMCGMEETPWITRAAWDGELLVIDRAESDSGNVYVPWPVERHGQLMLSTACLMQREQPYILEVELARGSMNQLRNQIAAWQAVGLVVPKEVEDRLSEATVCFANAATSQSQPALAAEHAVEAIRLAADVSNTLGKSYVAQAIPVRRRQTSELSTLLGVNLGSTVPDGDTVELIQSTFNTAIVPTSWRNVEAQEGKRDWSITEQQIAWCQSNGLKICGGPLLRMDTPGIPDWLYLWEGDFDNVLAFMLDFVKDTVTRFRGRVQLWHVASRINLGSAVGLSVDQILRVVATAIDTTRQLDPKTPIIVSFDQPWAEYMAKQESDFSPFGMADALIRADLGIAGVGLEINSGYYPHGSAQRNLLAMSQQLDHWSMLGVPLVVSVVSPSSDSEDASAQGPGRPVPGTDAVPISPESQQDWTLRHVPLMLAKNCVQAVIWNQLTDESPHEFPHGGLIDHRGIPKPAFESLRKIRQEYL